MFGVSPISRINDPPFRSSLAGNRKLWSGFPFRVAPWTYLFLRDVFLASIVKVSPRPWR